MEPMIYKPSIYNGAGIYKTWAGGGGGGGGGVTPVPDGYKELMWIATDVTVNSPYNSQGSFTSLGRFRNDTKIKISLYDFSLVKQWLVNNSITNTNRMIIAQVDGKARYITLEYNNSNLNFNFYTYVYGAGPFVQINDVSLENIIVEKEFAKIGENHLNKGGDDSGTFGYADTLYIMGYGSEIMPLKCGIVKIYDEQDNLIADFRPVEKIGGGNNRYGFYDVVNDVFRASIRNGRYFIGGPEIS